MFTHKTCMHHLFAWAIILVVASGSSLRSQTAPPEGIRKNTPTVHAFINARIVQLPGKVIDNATLVIRNGIIESVGSSVPPKDAFIWDLKGMTIYPGLIDAYSDYGMPKPPAADRRGREDEQQPQRAPEARGATNWNPSVLSNQNSGELFVPDAKAAEKLRGQGFTTVLAVPQKGIFKGMSALVNLGDGKPNQLIVKGGIAQHIALSTDPATDSYPGSLMGAIALIRQTLLDADWYQKANDAFARNPKLRRPDLDPTLATLKDVLTRKTPIVIECSDELDFLRADKIAKEFSLNLIVRGSGSEYKRLDAVKAAQRGVILPLNFPDVPMVQTAEEALQVSLSQLHYWDEAPENPHWLQEAGVRIAFGSFGLKENTTLLGQVRKAVERGLSPDAALAALTLDAARILGAEMQVGSLEPGKVANFIVTNGDLFAEKTRISDVWIDGVRYEAKPTPQHDPRGTWNVAMPSLPPGDTLQLILRGEVDALQGAVKRKREAKLLNASFSGLQLTLSFNGDSVGLNGVVRLSATVGAGNLTGNGEWADGSTFGWSAARMLPFSPEPDTAKPKPPVRASFGPVFPHGEYGRATLPGQPPSVLVKGATIWTSGPQGNIENGDLLVQKGRIVQVGRNLAAPADALIIDAKGKHVTAGLIDAHSHMAASGSVNEAGQAISAEVRVGDIIDCEDIDIYRALAGGLTSAHILHGSANPIGGQAQLIKLRWGMLPEEMKFENAPPTIKFALGENVKQSNWGDRFTTRYPQTRMGVEQIIRDEFRAALDCEKSWQRYEKEKNTIPPRRDLELETILEILKGKRFIHCHSYRQDEILMLMRVAEDFARLPEARGFKIQVFQHILEGYKVADVMAKHGAGGSSFSDWWGYKLEVYDAIPYNGALMHEQGVVVSFNSDSDELARRMNWEAAKAVKYGGVPEQEALKFVTLNPAKQLKVDNRVGSLEAGKDADFVIWSGNPLSTYSMCEQTWIDGRKFFDRDEDGKMRQEVQNQRAVLIQKALATKKSGPEEAPPGRPRRGDTFDHPDELSSQGEEKQ